MTAWGAIQYVGGGVSLVAFVVAAIFYAYRERLRSHAEIIRSAPEKDRLEAIATDAEFFRVDVGHLSTEAQSEIVLEQLRISSQRNLFLFVSFIVIAIVCGSIALAAILYGAAAPIDPRRHTSQCKDPAAQFPEIEQTRVSAFTYQAADPGNPHPSNWTRTTPDRWVEEISEGQNVFSTEKRINYGICDGTVITKIGEPNLQLLISDKNCVTKGLLFRRLPSCDWIGLPKMENVR